MTKIQYHWLNLNDIKVKDVERFKQKDIKEVQEIIEALRGIASTDEQVENRLRLNKTRA